MVPFVLTAIAALALTIRLWRSVLIRSAPTTNTEFV